jgi:hypothetical protein
LTQLGRRFGLSTELGSGVWCGENGVFVGSVPLLEQSNSQSRLDHWRPVSELNRDLSECYDLPIEFAPKIGGLTAASRALNRGDLLHAQIATMHLQIPDPPSLTKSSQNAEEIIDLARQLQASGLLKADWDSAKHPRWPAESPGGIGGEFAPAGTVSEDAAAGEARPPVIPAQITIPVPFELPGIQLPSEIVPPLGIPNINPRDLPRNPYPDRPECEAEWAEATSFCLGLMRRNQLGRGDYRGSGRTLSQCIMGQVSEACGGNSTGA